MRRPVGVMLGLALAANGLLMLFASSNWYELVPGVRETGPFNLHFVRDIGCAYIVAGSSLLWCLADRRAWPAVIAAGSFLSLHAATHLYDFSVGRIKPLHAASDAFLVIAPAVVALLLARYPIRPASKGDQ